MTPKEIKMQIDVYIETKEEEYREKEHECWLNGMYVLQALGAAFTKKNYPKDPLEEEKDGKTKEERKQNKKKQMLDMYVAQMLIRQANFNLSKKKESDNSEETA